MDKLDVHGLTLTQAKNVINKAVIQAYTNNTSVLYINHGFNKGSKIKTWCKNQLINNDLVIKVDSGDNEGISKVYIKLNIK
jgi:DNA-nicking Smr family endonuclease